MNGRKKPKTKLPTDRAAPVVDILLDVDHCGVPALEFFLDWAEAALDGCGACVIRVIDEATMTELNLVFAGNEKSTNVLAFPAPSVGVAEQGGWPRGLIEALQQSLGDIAICAPVVVREAYLQRKEPAAHWAHMVVHGILHLRGYDHITDDGARSMEAEEVRLLARLGYPDPYQSVQGADS